MAAMTMKILKWLGKLGRLSGNAELKRGMKMPEQKTNL